jgi:hypothetical protein
MENPNQGILWKKAEFFQPRRGTKAKAKSVNHDRYDERDERQKSFQPRRSRRKTEKNPVVPTRTGIQKGRGDITRNDAVIPANAGIRIGGREAEGFSGFRRARI